MRPVTPLFLFCFWMTGMVCGCKKSSAPEPVVVQPVSPLILRSVNFNDKLSGVSDYNININPAIKFSFNAPVNKSTLNNKVSFKNKSGSDVLYIVDYEKSDSTVIIKPSLPLDHITKYNVSITAGVKSTGGGTLSAAANAEFTTLLDSSRKFPVISDDALLDSVQRRTFNYFWKLAHPVSGMARERNTDAGIYTSGGTGFGIMAIVAAIHRNFITRSEGLT
ncbi:MAG: Ig-like domain-containing protein, partial [Chitinophagaceae bacterium]